MSEGGPVHGPVGGRARAAGRTALLFFLPVVFGSPSAPAQTAVTAVYGGSKNDVFDSLTDSLSSKGWTLDRVDKAIGLITTVAPRRESRPARVFAPSSRTLELEHAYDEARKQGSIFRGVEAGFRVREEQARQAYQDSLHADREAFDRSNPKATTTADDPLVGLTALVSSSGIYTTVSINVSFYGTPLSEYLTCQSNGRIEAAVLAPLDARFQRVEPTPVAPPPPPASPTPAAVTRPRPKR